MRKIRTVLPDYIEVMRVDRSSRAAMGPKKKDDVESWLSVYPADFPDLPEIFLQIPLPQGLACSVPWY